MSPDTKVHKPCGVNIGCCHHSPNDLYVQPRNWIFAVVPVKSPKVCLHHASQAIIGRPAHKASDASAGNAARNFPAFARREILNNTTAPDMVSKGRLLILFRNVAASASPVAVPSRTPGASVRSNFTRQMNAVPKHSGESTSF